MRTHLHPELFDLVHACLNKEAALRPDVLAIMRHPYVMRHQSNPCDLGAYLRSTMAPAASKDASMEY